MGSLRGDLSVLGIANLLQALAFNRCEGLLTLDLGTHPRVLYLHASGLRLARGSRRIQRLEKFLRSVARGGAHFRSAPPPEALNRLVREWMIDEVGDVLTWTRGTFRFQEASEAQAREQVLKGPLSTYDSDGDLMSLILEAARRADELPRLRAAISDLAVPEWAGDPETRLDPSIDGDVFLDVLPRIDGVQPVNAILQESIFPRFSVLQLLGRLAQLGSLRIDSRPAAASSAA